VRLALPSLGALIAEPLFIATDTAMVGHLGATALASLGLASTILTSVVGLLIFLAYATTPIVARRLGAKDRPGAISAGIDGMWLTGGLGVVLAGLGLEPAQLLPPHPTSRLLGWALRLIARRPAPPSHGELPVPVVEFPIRTSGGRSTVKNLPPACQDLVRLLDGEKLGLGCCVSHCAIGVVLEDESTMRSLDVGLRRIGLQAQSLPRICGTANLRSDNWRTKYRKIHQLRRALYILRCAPH